MSEFPPEPPGAGDPGPGDETQWISPPPRRRPGDRDPNRGGGSGVRETSRTAHSPVEPTTAVIDPDEHAANVMRWRRLSKERNAERREAFSEDSRHRRKYPWWIELPVLLIIAFMVTFLMQTFVARVYYVPSGSMETTLHGVESGGDRILAYKLGYDFGTPEQGDVVVFRGPPTWVPETGAAGPTTLLGRIGQMLGAVVGIAPPDEKDFVKRVIAVGGQTISCCDEQGRVQVDGVSLDEPYLFMDVAKHPQWAWIDGEDSCEVDPNDLTRFKHIRCFGPYTVPQDTVWVMGDHRSDSADSSYNCRGLVPGDNVHCQGPVPVDDVIGRAVAIVMPPSRWRGIGSPDIMQGADAQGDSDGESGEPADGGASGAEPTN